MKESIFTHAAQPGPFRAAEIRALALDLTRFNINKQRVYRGWALKGKRLLIVKLLSSGIIRTL
jgi:hypothetical protein